MLISCMSTIRYNKTLHIVTWYMDMSTTLFTPLARLHGYNKCMHVHAVCIYNGEQTFRRRREVTTRATRTSCCKH